MNRALAGEEPTAAEWFSYTGGTQHIHHEGIRILNEIMTLSGSSGLYHTSALQRRWRDIRCVSQHVAGNNGAMRALGAHLSGQLRPVIATHDTAAPATGVQAASDADTGVRTLAGEPGACREHVHPVSLAPSLVSVASSAPRGRGRRCAA